MAKITLDLMTGEKIKCSSCAKWVQNETITILTTDDTGLVTEVLCKDCADYA